MKLGISLLLWTDKVTNKLIPTLIYLKSIGYDSVEVPIFHFDIKKYEQLGTILDELQLARTAITARGKDTNPISENKKTREIALEHNKLSIDCCEALGSSLLAGIYHSAFNVISGAGPTDREFLAKESLYFMKKNVLYLKG